jgi:chromosome condensin MukBEF ATPase and DNA-binding subunit MukB
VQEEHTAQVDLLTAVHADQEALIADLSEQLSASAARCAELDRQLSDLCGQPQSPWSGVLRAYPTPVAQLHAAEDLALQLTEKLTRAQVCSSFVCRQLLHLFVPLCLHVQCWSIVTNGEQQTQVGCALRRKR